ncbi:MAG: 50S ribosomal protein L6 [Alphaproteobacteria bacterium]|nr:50S ribosomal protein L6 [Alphaproteobacteria bacterium]
MSRIGKLPILIPDNVKIKLTGLVIKVLGPYGELSREISPLITIKIKKNYILLIAKNNSRLVRQFHGLSRILINNMILGVSQKFEKVLELKGIGYRVQISDKELILYLGYSHPIIMLLPKTIEILLEGNNTIIIRGIDKEKVGQFASSIKSKRLPEPYKGKGIFYKGESIKLKVGKSGR